MGRVCLDLCSRPRLGAGVRPGVNRPQEGAQPMSERNHRFLEAALAYARLGWPIFPLAPGTKVPLKGTKGFEDATTDPQQIRRWWARWPAANIGLLPGAAGLVAIDLDVKGEVDGGRNWRDLKLEHNFDDDTLASRTPSFGATGQPSPPAPAIPQDSPGGLPPDAPTGGRHLFFRLPTGRKLCISNRRLGPGIDVRGHRGYVVLPPSEIRGGDHPGLYRWEAGPWARPPALVPAPLLRLLAANEGGPARGREPDRSSGPPAAVHGTAYCQAALRSELERLGATAKGERNDQLNRAAFSLGQLVPSGGLDQGSVEAALAQAARQVGLGEREALATIQSGLAAGAKAPRSISAGTERSATPSETSAVQIAPGAIHGKACTSPPVRGATPNPGEQPPSVRRGPPPPSAPRPPPAEKPVCPPLPPSAQPPASAGQNACRWLDGYIAFSRKWSPRSFDGYHEACGLWLLSTIAARRVLVHFGRPRYTNLYIILAGRTTMHAKSSATGIARDLLAACGLDYLLAPDEATPQSFLRALAGADLPPDFDELTGDQQIKARLRLGFCGQRGWYAEEFGSWLASMVRTDGVMADFRGLLRRLDDCPSEYRRSTIARGTEQVDRPYLAQIGNLTPADLRPLARKGAQLWGDGFLARFAFVTPPQDEVLTARFPPGERAIPQELAAPLVRWHRQLGMPQVTVEDRRDPAGNPTGEKIVTIGAPEAQTCALCAGVEDALYRYNEALLAIAQDSDQTDLDGNYGRLHEKALRVAALLASLENEGRIELRHWARAQEIAERWRLYTHRLYQQVTQPESSATAEMEDKILDVVARWQSTERYPEGLTANQIGRFVRGLGRAEVKFHADQLVATGVLDRRQIQGKRTCRYTVPDTD